MPTQVANNLKRKSRRPHPSQVKKHSDIMRRNAQAASRRITGDREKTDYGFRVKGFQGKSFETYLEVMMEDTSTPVLKHEKKDRTIRVATGMLVVATDTVTVYHTGEEAVLERGTEYRLISPQAPVEFFVTQSAKYEATLEVVDASEAKTAEVTDELLEGFSPQPTIEPTRRRGSKARENLARAASKRKTSAQVQSMSKAPRPAEKPAGTPVESSHVEGFSPQPSMGNFDDSTAG